MTDREKVQWAKRAFAEIARNCQDVARLEIVDERERRAWESVATQALRNIEILEQ